MNRIVISLELNGALPLCHLERVCHPVERRGCGYHASLQVPPITTFQECTQGLSDTLCLHEIINSAPVFNVSILV